MRILHILLGGAFNESMSYQGNMLPKYNVEDGHEVYIITSTYEWEQDQIINVGETIYKSRDGIIVYRLKFSGLLVPMLNKKIRRVPKLKKILESIKPEVILHHDIEGHSLLVVAKYIKHNPKTVLYVDTHSDHNNSAQNILSKYILHRIIYRYFVKKALPYIKKILYVSYQCKKFAIENHKINNDSLEFFPLGGTVIDMNEKQMKKIKLQRTYNIPTESIILTHSGKMDNKKKTLELLTSLSKSPHKNNIFLILVGKFSREIYSSAMEIINNENNILMVGWKSSNELIEIIAGSDYYIQPGSQSATMQISLCQATPVIIEYNESHELYRESGAIYINHIDDLDEIFTYLVENYHLSKELSCKAYDFSLKYLDYKVLSKRILK
jgi:glycosyltransferase involved in cell wall biosynthesis